jgi:redox-sensitive bicupin YhaK (pirin superfamily)
MTAPRYVGLQRDQIPVLDLEGADGTPAQVRMQLVSGTYGGVTGPVESLTDVFMSTVEMKAGSRLYLDGLLERSLFLYVVRGVIQIATDTVSAFHLAEFDLVGDELEIRAKQDCVLLLGHAAPIGEPVVSHGPFVMNTREEINQAIIDYQAGRFGDPI